MEKWEKLGITDDEFYGMGFGEENVVSIWLGFTDDENDEGKDILQEMCGVGYYDIDFNEVMGYEGKLLPVREIVAELSYSDSFIDGVLDEAEKKGIKEALYVVAQYDFAFDPNRANQNILKKSKDPIFIGVFPYAVPKESH